MNLYKKISTSIFLMLVFILPTVVSAAWDGHPYSQGSTLNPECDPTDSNCTVGISNTTTATSSSQWITGDGGKISYGLGNIGIGTTDPVTALHIASNGNDILTLQSKIGGGGNTANLNFQTYDTQEGGLFPTASISAIDDGSYSSGLAFLTKTPGVQQNSLAERMRITSTGDVGIGTASPLAKFDVSGSVALSGSNNYLNFGDTAGIDGYGIRDNGGVMEFKNSSGNWTGIGSGGGISQWSSDTSGIDFLSGNIGIGASSTSDTALTVSGSGNTVSFTQIASYETDTIPATSVAVSGTTMYAVDGNVLQTFDITNPATQVNLGLYDFGVSTYAVKVFGTNAYVAAGNSVQILDVSNPSTPTILGSFSTAGVAQDLFVKNNILYLIDTNSNFYVVNVSDPTNPTQDYDYVTHSSTGGGPHIDVSGNYAYISESGEDEIVDISNPNNVQRVSGYSNGGGYTGGIAVSGNYMYILPDIGGRNFSVVDTSNKSNPVLVGSTIIGPNSWRYRTSIVMDGSYAYIADGEPDSIYAVNVNDPTNPIVAGHISVGYGNTYGVAISGNTIFSADGNNGVDVFTKTSTDNSATFMNGNVGIGTLTPSAALEVGGIGSGTFIDGISHSLLNIHSANENPWGLTFQNDTAGSGKEMGAFLSNDGSLEFYSSGSGNPKNSLSLNQDGRVAIGTTNFADSGLTVQNSNLNLLMNNNFSGSTTDPWWFSPDFWSHTGGGMSFHYSDTSNDFPYLYQLVSTTTSLISGHRYIISLDMLATTGNLSVCLDDWSTCQNIAATNGRVNVTETAIGNFPTIVVMTGDSLFDGTVNNISVADVSSPSGFGLSILSNDGSKSVSFGVAPDNNLSPGFLLRSKDNSGVSQMATLYLSGDTSNQYSYILPSLGGTSSTTDTLCTKNLGNCNSFWSNTNGGIHYDSGVGIGTGSSTLSSSFSIKQGLTGGDVEQITNGNFATGTDGWTLGSGWTSDNASAIFAGVTAGSIGTWSMNSFGSGYHVGDVLTADGGNGDATFQATQIQGSVTNFNIIDGGSGYTTTDVLTINAGSQDEQVSIDSVDTNGSITAAHVSSYGSADVGGIMAGGGFTYGLMGGSGDGYASISPTDGFGSIQNLNLLTAGTNYSTGILGLINGNGSGAQISVNSIDTGGPTTLYQSGSLSEGGTYNVSFYISGTTGNVSVCLDGGDCSVSVVAGNGTTTFSGVWHNSIGAKLVFSPSVDFNGYITNISVTTPIIPAIEPLTFISSTSSTSLSIGLDEQNSTSGQYGFLIKSIDGSGNYHTATLFPSLGNNTSYQYLLPSLATSSDTVCMQNLANCGSTTWTNVSGGIAYDTGSVSIGNGVFSYDATSSVVSISNASLGSFTFPDDAGVVSWIDMPVTDSSASDTVESYSASIGGTAMLTVYGQSDGAGNIVNTRVGINNTTPDQTFSVNGQISFSGLNTADTSSGYLCIDGTNQVVTSAGACDTSSSRRFKKDINDLTVDSGVAEVMKLNPVTFFYTPEFNGAFSTDTNYNSEQVGFIAEDVAKIDPRLVTYEKDGTTVHGVRYEKFVSILTKAIQSIENTIIGFAGRFTSKEIDTDKLCVGGTCVTQAEFLKMVQSSGSTPLISSTTTDASSTTVSTSTTIIIPDTSTTTSSTSTSVSTSTLATTTSLVSSTTTDASSTIQ